MTTISPARGHRRCNKGGNPPYHFGLSQQGRVALIRHNDDFKLVAPCKHFMCATVAREYTA